MISAGLVIAPVVGSKMVAGGVLPLMGSIFGSSHGFTQIGATGVVVPKEAFAPDGL